jgi:hypothetical protein
MSGPHALLCLAMLAWTLNPATELAELRAVAAHLRMPDLPEARAEASHKICDLMSGTQHEPWHAINLAS